MWTTTDITWIWSIGDDFACLSKIQSCTYDIYIEWSFWLLSKEETLIDNNDVYFVSCKIGKTIVDRNEKLQSLMHLLVATVDVDVLK